MFKRLDVQTHQQVEMIDITAKIQGIVQGSGVDNGLVTVFVPHTTAAITINEKADPDVQRDIIAEINKVIPFSDDYKHFEGNSAAHIKSSLFGSSETIIIEGGRMQLGRWQCLYFCEFDGSRNRQVFVQVTAGN